MQCEKEHSIVSFQDYGSIEVRLKEYMDARSISRNALARAIHARFEVVDKWYEGNVEKLDLDILARICYALDCKAEDILVYRPTKR